MIKVPNNSTQLAQKANKTQEAWIAPTLINNWAKNTEADDVGFRKDEFGVVRFRGMLMSGTSGTIAFVLPTGYRPAKHIRQPISASASSVGVILIAVNGEVTVYGTTLYLSLSGITFTL